jgi:hypothetical protein
VAVDSKMIQMILKESDIPLTVAAFDRTARTNPAYYTRHNPVNDFFAMLKQMADKEGIGKAQHTQFKKHANEMLRYLIDGIKVRDAGGFAVPFKSQGVGNGKMAKKVAKLGKQDPAIQAICNEALMLEVVVDHYAELIGMKPSKAELLFRHLEDAPLATKAARNVVSDILQEMTERVKQQFIDDMVQAWSDELSTFLQLAPERRRQHLKVDAESCAALAKANADAKAKYEKETGRNYGGPREMKRVVQSIERLLNKYCDCSVDRYALGKGVHDDYTWDKDDNRTTFVNPGGTQATWTMKSDWQALVLADVTKHANEMQNFFVHKNTDKMAVIIEIKDNLKGKPEILNVHTSYGVIQGNVKFSFLDGSYFTVRNKIVEKGTMDWYGNCTPFWQFPTTFHQVMMPKGRETTAMVPEEQMINTFAVTGGKTISDQLKKWLDELLRLRAAAHSMTVTK